MPNYARYAASALLVALVGCATVAVTGRSQFNIVADADLVRYANASYAKLIGDAEAKNSVLKASESGAAAETIRSVSQVSNRIIDAVKGKDYPVTERSVDVQILGLRKKLGEYGERIRTVRGVGYRFQDGELGDAKDSE